MKWPKTDNEFYHGHSTDKESGKHPYEVTKIRFRKIERYASFVAHNLGYTKVDERFQSKEFIEEGIRNLRLMIDALEAHHEKLQEVQVIKDVLVHVTDLGGDEIKQYTRMDKRYEGPMTMEKM